jgi:hypothetical protein
MEEIGSFDLDKPHRASVAHLYRNNHDRTSAEVPHVGAQDRAITVMAANFGDLDNDGWLDVYLGLVRHPMNRCCPSACFATTMAVTFRM